MNKRRIKTWGDAIREMPDDNLAQLFTEIEKDRTMSYEKSRAAWEEVLGLPCDPKYL